MIRVPVKRETTSVAVQARQRAALDIWDRSRAAQGLPRWHVACAYAGLLAVDDPQACKVVDVTPRVRCDTDVYVPHAGALVQSADESTDDHHTRLEALFEWIGMACVGAQRQVPSRGSVSRRMLTRRRLRANDRVDPYVAVYDVPEPASIGDVVHVRWKGLMDSRFVQSVIDTAMYAFLSLPRGACGPLMCVTLDRRCRRHKGVEIRTFLSRSRCIRIS